jgi:glutathione S-transferase
VLVSLVVWMKSKHRSLAMPPTITAFATSPDRGKGLARDMQVRWALEEVGQPYDVRLVSFKAMKEPAHRAVHPFGQIPTYEDGELALFESGAILIHLAEHHRGLLPKEPNARARAIMWMFAAVDTLKAPIIEREAAWLIERDKSWFAERQVMLDGNVRRRLGELSVRLGDADWLDGDFSAADIMMVGLLRRLETTSLLDDHPNLLAYVARGKARPAFKRAFEAQYAVFTDSQPAG